MIPGSSTFSSSDSPAAQFLDALATGSLTHLCICTRPRMSWTAWGPGVGGRSRDTGSHVKYPIVSEAIHRISGSAEGSAFAVVASSNQHPWEACRLLFSALAAVRNGPLCRRDIVASSVRLFEGGRHLFVPRLCAAPRAQALVHKLCTSAATCMRCACMLSAVPVPAGRAVASSCNSLAIE